MSKRSHVVLYSKPGCHLCEEMKAEIARANCAEMYDLDEIDIESDPELLARYRNDIPVVTIDGVEVFRHHLSAYVFKAYIAASAFRQ